MTVPYKSVMTFGYCIGETHYSRVRFPPPPVCKKKLKVVAKLITIQLGHHSSSGMETNAGDSQLLLAFSSLPVDGVLFEVGVDGAAYGRIEVFGAEAIE